ncbi:hypothetical protein K3G63_06735 [Hymenobacter sp. HSC-4F20]|uniref:hypothetical protein n=1 Tax=Hymenobacter sp. HSC-4F20 TaxID=2864135 RepID=UPI001C73B2BD|nr:hypothetical protein [Hymenobacter sp. HSC-4F20]MBX0290127.1 hypothetical protein [Hymenobacter sp. HSC-4F20]
MATPDLNKLQQILQNAETNDAVLTQIRKHVEKVTQALDELNAMLEPGYRPEKKVRAPRAEGAKRPGRPRKNQEN